MKTSLYDTYTEQVWLMAKILAQSSRHPPSSGGFPTNLLVPFLEGIGRCGFGGAYAHINAHIKDQSVLKGWEACMCLVSCPLQAVVPEYPSKFFSNLD